MILIRDSSIESKGLLWEDVIVYQGTMQSIVVARHIEDWDQSGYPASTVAVIEFSGP